MENLEIRRVPVEQGAEWDRYGLAGGARSTFNIELSTFNKAGAPPP
jgi:hypothetical protein